MPVETKNHDKKGENHGKTINLEENSPVLQEEIPEIKRLTFARLKFPRLIPVTLIESVRGRTFSPEEFYKYQEEQVNNPYNYLYAVLNDQKKIEGYLWCETNVLDGALFVNTFSVSKKYWGKGAAIPLAIEFLKSLKEKTKAKRVFWITTNQMFFEKQGFHKSKNVLMEYHGFDV